MTLPPFVKNFVRKMRNPKPRKITSNKKRIKFKYKRRKRRDSKQRTNQPTSVAKHGK